MTISDERSDEEQAIMAFVRRHFEATGMRNALRVLDESKNISDVRAIFDYYRELYEMRGKH